ncbi:MAG: hypothetical protein Q9214_001814, partial [Letrouitia sp. 1 TL-2023]
VTMIKAGDSMVAQATLPGMLKREWIEVLPWGYQSVIHCIRVPWIKQSRELWAEDAFTQGFDIPAERIARDESTAPNAPAKEEAMILRQPLCNILG